MNTKTMTSVEIFQTKMGSQSALDAVCEFCGGAKWGETLYHLHTSGQHGVSLAFRLDIPEKECQQLRSFIGGL